MPQEDEVFPAEEQPLPAAASPTAQSPDYVSESDPEEDPEEDDDEDPEEDPVDYLADGGDDGDDEDEPSDDDEDEEVDIEADDEEEDEHQLLLTPQLLLYQLPIRPHLRRRQSPEATSTSHSLPLPPPIILSHIRTDAPSSGTPPLHLLSTDRREDRPEVTLPPRKRLCIALGPTYEVIEEHRCCVATGGGNRGNYGFVATIDREIRRDLERDVGYGITDSWDEIVEAMQGTPVVTDVAEFSQRMTEFETRVRRDTDKVYTRLMETEARMSRKAWGRSMDANDLARDGDYKDAWHVHRGQEQLTKALKLVKRLQTQMAELQRQQGPAKGPAQPELPEEAGSSS
ncbi:hypothetical protein Tco_0158909 [Tanacetum coccineum]